MINNNLTMNHPTYTEAEAHVMQSSCADLKNSDTPHHLRIRECVRRQIKGKGDFYIDIATKVQSELIDLMLDENMNLTDTYSSREYTAPTVKGKKLNEGDVDANGNYYVPFFRKFVPYEHYLILSPIGKLRGYWNNWTWFEGRKLGDVAAFRVQCINDGTAARLIEKAGLKANLIEKLPTTYKPRS